MLRQNSFWSLYCAASMVLCFSHNSVAVSLLWGLWVQFCVCPAEGSSDKRHEQNKIPTVQFGLNVPLQLPWQCVGFILMAGGAARASRLTLDWTPVSSFSLKGNIVNLLSEFLSIDNALICTKRPDVWLFLLSWSLLFYPLLSKITF